MVFFGGPAALFAQTGTSSEQTSDAVAGQNGGIDATTTATSTDTSASSSAVVVGDNGTSTAHETAGETASSATSTASSTDGIAAMVTTGDASSTGVVTSTTNVGSTTIGTSTASTTVQNNSDLTASSTATSTAQTGSNAVADTDGALVATGNAHSFGALISLFNIVITNSAGQLIFLQNPLGGVDLTDRFMSVFSATSTATVGTSTCTLVSCDSPYGSLKAVTTGTADIVNTLIVRSGTGGNTAESEQGPTHVMTGNADAFGSIVNIGNLQIINSRYLVVLLNNIGNLIGDIVLPTADFFASLSNSVSLMGDTSIATDSTADITNSALSTADTGNNVATGTQNADIHTGQAFSGVDVHNFINTNTLGGRPVCFIVSVGGTWDGTVVGLPNSFSQESTPFGKIICGSGTGTSTASLTRLTASTTNYAKILNNAIVEATTGNNNASGTIAKIKTGDASAFLQILNLVDQNIIGTDWVFALFTISGDWHGDLTFGSKAFWDAINAQVAVLSGQGSSALRLGPANISIQKQVSPTDITGSSTVGYAVKVYNTGDPIYHAKLIDTIYDVNHNPIHRQVWDLDTIGEHEEVDLSYTVAFSASSTPGVYTNEAYLDGYDQNPDIAHNLGRHVVSPIATATLTIHAPEQPVPVVVAQDTCQPYLTTYIKYGQANDPADVLRLQQFFIEHEHASNIRLTGLYDAATRNAVKQFQEQHAGEILSPWGVQAATGYVYYTTQHMINEIYCNGKRVFDYSPLQLEEIERYRSSLELNRSRGEVVPQEEINDRVGRGPTNTRLAVRTPQPRIASDTMSLNDETNVPAQAQTATVNAAPAATGIFGKIRAMLGAIFSR